MNLLVVEDESSLNNFLSNSFANEGYTVRSVSTLDGLNQLLNDSNYQPQAVILDRLLDGADSAEHVPAIKERFKNSKVIVLSAIGGPIEKSKVLDVGADDYVSKPFSIEELSSRLRAALRNTVSEPVQVYGNLTLNLFNHIVEVDGKTLELSKKEYQLLTALIRTPTKVFNRYQLLNTIWNIQADVESNVVEVTIKNLRKKLESINASVQILSKRNVGYWVEV